MAFIDAGPVPCTGMCLPHQPEKTGFRRRYLEDVMFREQARAWCPGLTHDEDLSGLPPEFVLKRECALIWNAARKKAFKAGLKASEQGR